jgi:hypothetical protein
MEINLSKKTIETVYNSLRETEYNKREQLRKRIPKEQKQKIEELLTETEEAMAVFSELMDRIVILREE